MIAKSDLACIGAFARPHGVKGEVSAVFDYDFDDISPKHIFVEIDGLMVPFTVTGKRDKGSRSVLLTLKGVCDEQRASAFSNKPVYVERDMLSADDEADDENFYLEDLIGFQIVSGGNSIGVIADYDDSTENILFAVDTPDGKRILIPATDDFIDEIDVDAAIITMSLPAGLLDI